MYRGDCEILRSVWNLKEMLCDRDRKFPQVDGATRVELNQRKFRQESRVIVIRPRATSPSFIYVRRRGRSALYTKTRPRFYATLL